MGEIFVEGFGVIEIEGDIPNEQETQSILEAIGDPEDEGDPTITNIPTPPIPEPIIPGGRPSSGEGPLGLMPAEIRTGIRQSVEKQPGLMQLITEISPSAAGTAIGATVGTPLGPAGMIGGAMLGGIAGELIAQETGIAPESELNLALAGGGPLAGPVVGGGLRLGRRGIGAAITKGFPAARVARARNVMGRAVSEFESIGATILNKSAGAGQTANQIYQAASRAKARIRPEQLKATRAEIAKLVKKLTPVSALPDVGQSLKALEQISKTMLSNPKGILLEEFVEARSFIGAIVGNLSKKGGAKLNVSKKVFAVMSDDLDKIARGTAVVGRKARSARQARLFQQGIARAKLQFAVQRLENKVAQFTQRNVKGVPGGIVINFKSLSKWVDDVTNLKSAKFDKNFTEVLKDHLPALKKRIGELAEISSTGSPGGPGSIVLRGQTAKIGRALVGGALGFLGTGGTAVGAAIGGIAFAQAPEMLVGILTTKAGAAFLEAAAKAGKGQISRRAWLVASEIAFRSLGQTKEVSAPPGSPKSSSVGPVTIDTPTTLRE
ncbi:hypothetical protein LCGC14_1902030, partial [marine sediment metagenome]